MYPKSFDCPRCTMLIAGHLCPAYLFSGRIGHSVAPLSIRQARFRLAIVESPANLVSGPLGGATRGVPFTTLVGRRRARLRAPRRGGWGRLPEELSEPSYHGDRANAHAAPPSGRLVVPWGNVVDAMPLATDAAVQPARSWRAVVLPLIVILLVQLALCSWFAVNKDGLFQDESYTYFLANGNWLNSVPEEGVIYTDGEPWREWASVDSFLGIDPEMLYKNQESDNHPPLYYIFFSLAYSLFPGSVNPVIGVAVNIVFALITTVELYFLSRLLDVPRRASLVLCALWAINPGMVNCMLYLRMYQLLMVFFLAAAIAAFSYVRRDRIGPGIVACVFLATVGGLLTQYFFLFFAFILYLCCGIALLARRRIAHAAIFAGATVGGGGRGHPAVPAERRPPVLELPRPGGP